VTVEVTYSVTIVTDPITNTAEISKDNADEFVDSEGNPMVDIDSVADGDSSNDAYSLDNKVDGDGTDDEDDSDPAILDFSIVSTPGGSSTGGGSNSGSTDSGSTSAGSSSG